MIERVGFQGKRVSGTRGKTTYNLTHCGRNGGVDSRKAEKKDDEGMGEIRDVGKT